MNAVITLPRRQQQLHDLLLGRGDVPIQALYETMRETDAVEDPSIAQMQRWLSPYISALNKKITCRGLRVEPGAVKSTYRLVAA